MHMLNAEYIPSGVHVNQYTNEVNTALLAHKHFGLPPPPCTPSTICLSVVPCCRHDHANGVRCNGAACTISPRPRAFAACFGLSQFGRDHVPAAFIGPHLHTSTKVRLACHPAHPAIHHNQSDARTAPHQRNKAGLPTMASHPLHQRGAGMHAVVFELRAIVLQGLCCVFASRLQERVPDTWTSLEAAKRTHPLCSASAGRAGGRRALQQTGGDDPILSCLPDPIPPAPPPTSSTLYKPGCKTRCCPGDPRH